MAVCMREHPEFEKSSNFITAISNARPAVVTTSTANRYVNDMFVRIKIPIGFGMPELNNRQVRIAIISDTQFSIDVDTTEFEPFAVPMNALQCAQSVPIGAFEKLDAATRNIRND